MTINAMCEKVNSALARKGEAEDYVFENNEWREEVLDMERERLFSGSNADGSAIKPAYTPVTVLIKKKKGQPADRVTLFDTGAFHGAFTMERKGDTVLFSSSDSKTEKLVDKYGEGIFGLNEENRNLARAGSAKLILEWFLEETGI